MLEACVAASQIHLQLLCHAYFTVPLLHQVSTVSLFPVIFTARLGASPAVSGCVCI